MLVRKKLQILRWHTWIFSPSTIVSRRMQVVYKSMYGYNILAFYDTRQKNLENVGIKKKTCTVSLIWTSYCGRYVQLSSVDLCCETRTRKQDPSRSFFPNFTSNLSRDKNDTNIRTIFENLSWLKTALFEAWEESNNLRLK